MAHSFRRTLFVRNHQSLLRAIPIILILIITSTSSSTSSSTSTSTSSSTSPSIPTDTKTYQCSCSPDPALTSPSSISPHLHLCVCLYPSPSCPSFPYPLCGDLFFLTMYFLCVVPLVRHCHFTYTSTLPLRDPFVCARNLSVLCQIKPKHRHHVEALHRVSHLQIQCATSTRVAANIYPQRPSLAH